MVEILIRVVIDTNIWVSALINPHGAPPRLMRAVRDRHILHVVSQPLLDEVATVIQRPRIRRRIGLDNEEIAAFVARARQPADIVPVPGAIHIPLVAGTTPSDPIVTSPRCRLLLSDRPSCRTLFKE